MTEVRRIQRPIFLLGFHRSGTSLLGRIFSQHPDVAYWPEPRHVWMYYYPYRRLDVMTENDATPRSIRKIHDEFSGFLDDAGRSQFVEKTPSNMVRLPFIRKVAPDCRIIHIIRDGRACTYSTVQVLRRPYTRKEVGRRMRQVPAWHYPAYIPKFWRNAVIPQLRGKPIPYWGPRIPGLRERVGRMSLEELCAWQWQQTMNFAVSDATSFMPEQYREWRYEDLVTDPVRVVREMFDFVALQFPENLETWLSGTINRHSLDKWRDNLTDDQIASINLQMEPLLSNLGYS